MASVTVIVLGQVLRLAIPRPRDQNDKSKPAQPKQVALQSPKRLDFAIARRWLIWGRFPFIFEERHRSIPATAGLRFTPTSIIHSFMADPLLTAGAGVFGLIALLGAVTSGGREQAAAAAPASEPGAGGPPRNGNSLSGRRLTVCAIAFLSPSAYFLLLLLADRFHFFPSPPEFLVVSLFYFFPAAALLVCGTAVWSSGMAAARKFRWMAITLVAMLLQFGFLLALMITAAG